MCSLNYHSVRTQRTYRPIACENDRFPAFENWIERVWWRCIDLEDEKTSLPVNYLERLDPTDRGRLDEWSVASAALRRGGKVLPRSRKDVANGSSGQTRRKKITADQLAMEKSISTSPIISITQNAFRAEEVFVFLSLA